MPLAARHAPSALPATPSPASERLSVHPGHTLLVCLPPGASLVVEQGCLALRTGPLVCGQVLAPHVPLGRLEAGQCRTGTEGSGTEWMELSNPGHTTVHAVLWEPAPVLSPLVGLFRACLERLAGGTRALHERGGQRPGTSGHRQQTGAQATPVR